MAYKIDPKLCVACSTCIEDCPVGAISEGDVYTIDAELCIECGSCASVCPGEAIGLCEDMPSSDSQDRIPDEYVQIVKNSLIASAAVAPAGLLGGLDAVAVGATWATMFVAIRNRAGSSLGGDPRRICVGVASGIARYYIACKAATYAFFLVPGVGPFVAVASAIGISGVCNIYFTYSFAATLIDLFNRPIYNDDDIINFFINHLKRLPNATEVREIIKIYQS